MNKPCLRLLITVAVTAASTLCIAGESRAKSPSDAVYLMTNDDNGVMYNTISIYEAASTQSGPTLIFQDAINISGRGIAGGFFGTPRITMLPDASAQCLYASNASTGDIATVNLQTQQLVGNYAGFSRDKGNTNGIGLVINSNYLYASYTASNTIAVFAVQGGCQLSLVNDVAVAGLNGGWIGGMALHGNVLVVAYGDGSIQSFNVAGGLPVSNNDEQNSAGFANAYFPESVDITQDGHFAIFGDGAVPTTIEVSDISTGKLLPTVQYTFGVATNAVGPGINSSTVRLSPDQSLIYIGNSQSGNITAAFFNKNTGKVTPGCASATLGGFYNPWSYIGSLATRDTTGTGGVLYAAEFGSSIAIITVTSDGNTCTLTESAASPVGDDLSPGLLSIQVFPPRPF
jgi:6-phosphogluconolactonase (cycloisomerase 2 family)